MKENLLTETAKLAMYITKAYIKEGDFAVDATCGNGHDTLALARAVGKKGKVLAIDLQEEAVASTQRQLTESGLKNTVLVCGSFIHLPRYLEEHSLLEEPKAVVFNLGYLPGGNKSVTTRAEDTLCACESSLNLIKTGGILTVVMYPGHPEGKREQETLLAWARTLDSSRFHVVYANLPNQRRNPPEILWISKKFR